MSNYIAIHDTRLSGAPGWDLDLDVITCNGSTRLSNVFTQVNRIAGSRRASPRSKPIHSIFILCHGFAGSNSRARVSMDAGGMGLQLCRENVLHSNISLWEAIRDVADNIVVYACAAANTESGNEYTSADGRYLMGAMAIHTNADVYAGDRIQWYRTTSHRLFWNRIDFGDWEGQLLHFPPSGAQSNVVASPPVELNSVY